MTSGRKRINETLSSTPRRVVALFAAIGTIVAAVAGVKGLLPKSAPPPEVLSAKFGDVTANGGVTLEEYDERASTGIIGASHTASTGAVPYELAADTTVAPNVSQTGATGSSTSTKSATPSTEPKAAEPKGSTQPSGTTETKSSTGSAEQESPGDTTSTSTSSEEAERETSSSGHSTSTETKPPKTTSTGTEEEGEPEEGGTGKSGSGEGHKHPGGKLRPEVPEVEYPRERQPTPQGGEEAAQEPSRHVDGALVSNGSHSEREFQNVMQELSTEATEASPPGQESEAAPLAPSIVKHCQRDANCGARQEVDKALTYDPNPVKAAQAVKALFNNSRAEVFEKHLYPIGAMVTYNVNLSGFAHETATLEWSLLSNTHKRQLPRPWWHNIPVAHIKPLVNEESLTGTFWVPAPPRHGNYVVRLVVLDSNRVPHASIDSTPVFH